VELLVTVSRWLATLALVATTAGDAVQAAPQAQAPETAPPAPTDAPASGGLQPWLLAGVAVSTVRGDCQTCETDFPYRQGPGLVAGGGIGVHPRVDVGAEVLWVPVEYLPGERVHTTHIDAVARFRPWASQGFLLKGGAGLALVRNWVDVPGLPPFDSQGMSVVVGAGWLFRTSRRVGVEVFATQHAAALGDLQSATTRVEDVLGNFWSVGASVVFR
jgi:hypothetical protein